MTPTTYQTPEIRDSNDNIIKQGSFGKNTALANSTNDGWIDYVANDLEFLYGLAKDEVVPVSELPSTGDTNKTYLLTTTGVCYRWSGTEWVAVSSSEAVGRADSAAYLAEQWATKTSGTVDGTEYSAKYYAEQAQDTADDLSESLEQIATNTANIEENAENIAQNTTDIDIAEKRIGNIEKLLQGNLYDYQTNSNSAYTKTVPQGAMPYASIEQIGGKTLVWNQLNRCNAQTYSYNGITFTNNGDGSFTVTGTATQRVVWYINSPNVLNVTPGHKFILTAFCTDSSMYSHICMGIYEDTTWRRIVNANTILTVGANENKLFYVYIEVLPNMGEVNFTISSLILSDLTPMFGAGNEPTTVAEFQQTFPAVWYAFNEGTLLSAGVTEVVSKKADTTEIATYSIPAEIRNLEGYGWSAGSVYNYIDYERKVFVQNVGSVDLGTLTWTKLTGKAVPLFTSNAVTDAKAPASGTDMPNILAQGYVTGLYADVTDDQNKDKYINMIFATSALAKRVYMTDSNPAYTDATAFTNAMNGVYMYYELATPVEIDISAYLTDDNLISVEAGGTLTFENQHGDDYRIDVPSAETYMVDLQSALGE